MQRSFWDTLRFFFVQLRARVGGFRCWQCNACGWGRWEPVWTRKLLCENDECRAPLGAYCSRRPFWDR